MEVIGQVSFEPLPSNVREISSDQFLQAFNPQAYDYKDIYGIRVRFVRESEQIDPHPIYEGAMLGDEGKIYKIKEKPIKPRFTYAYASVPKKWVGTNQFGFQHSWPQLVKNQILQKVHDMSFEFLSRISTLSLKNSRVSSFIEACTNVIGNKLTDHRGYLSTLAIVSYEYFVHLLEQEALRVLLERNIHKSPIGFNIGRLMGVNLVISTFLPKDVDAIFIDPFTVLVLLSRMKVYEDDVFCYLTLPFSVIVCDTRGIVVVKK